MKKFKYYIVVLFLGMFASVANAQIVLSSFEDGSSSGIEFVDTWEDSPFNDGRCSNTPMVIDNPYLDDMNSSEKVLHVIRPYYAGDRNGVEIKLERPFNLTTQTQYVHIFIHKPVASRILLRGKNTGSEVMQFEKLSQSESRANAWSDAVFAIKGSNLEIDRLVLYPDCESALGRINGDLDIYIDDIVISNSPDPRSVTDYCKVNGTKTTSRYISTVSTTGASMNINAEFDGVPENIYTKYNSQAIVAEAGSPFTLNIVQKSSSRSNKVWALDVYVDFNADKEFVSDGEYLGRLEGTVNGKTIEYSKEITVPAGTNVSSCAIRIKANNPDDAPAEPEFASCDDVTDGMVLNIPMEISQYVERPIITISGSDGQSGWGAIRFKGIEGTEVKVNNGTKVTALASPNNGYEFDGWYSKETGGILSESEEFTFSAEFSIGLIAKFKELVFCEPTGTTPVSAWLGKLMITPEGQSGLYFFGDASNEISEVSSNYYKYSVLGGVNVKRQTTFTLTATKSSASGDLTGKNFALWVDWNNDHDFADNEFIAQSEIQGDEIIIATYVPENAVSGNIYGRLMISDNAITNADECYDMGNGIAYDLMLTITPNDNERFSLSAIPNVAGAATFTLSPAPGEDGKYAAGTNVDITCVPAEGYQFVQWMKDGIPYGATMTSNNPLPVTALNQDLNLTMKVEPKFPEYCEGTTPNNGDGDHYGITEGYVMVNSVTAFNFTKSASITDLSESCIADVCPGDTIKIFVSGAMHTTWAQGIAYIDWNMDGTWSEGSDEAYELFNNPGSQVTNKQTDIIVPENVGTGCFGIRICSGEAPAHNSLGGGPCQARKRGTLFTFRVNSTALPAAEPKLNISKGGGCSVIITDTDGNELANKDIIASDATFSIVVSIDDEYLLDNVNVNGFDIVMEENDGIYYGSFTSNSAGAKVVVSTNKKEYCEPTETLRRTDRTDGSNDNRYLTEVSLRGSTYPGSSSISVSGLSQDPHRIIYEDHTDQVLNCYAGDVLTPTLSFNGSWMHKYVYVDWDRNYVFNVGSSGNWEELVSFNYINGVTSSGATGSNQGSSALGAFTVPADAGGLYRIRYKLDWDSTDPCGRFDDSNNILDNGGGIVDFMLNVYNNSTYIKDTEGSNVTVFGTDNKIVVTGIENGIAYIYAPTSGKLLNSITVIGTTSIDIENGIYIVKVIEDDFSTVNKVIVK